MDRLFQQVLAVTGSLPRTLPFLPSSPHLPLPVVFISRSRKPQRKTTARLSLPGCYTNLPLPSSSAAIPATSSPLSAPHANLVPHLFLLQTMAASGGGSSAQSSRPIAAVAAVAAVLVVLSSTWCCLAEFPKLEHATKPDGSLSVLVVGDWGRKGLYNQSRVAEQMGRIGTQKRIDFVVSTGDNFYEDGLTGVDDPAFEQSFTSIYTAPSLQTQWYSVLGNHDYRGDVLAQLSPALTQIDRRWLCMRSFVLSTEVADFFFVDTTPFQLKYWQSPEKEDHNYDWRGVVPREEYIAGVLSDLDCALRESKASWKFVIGHHTMRSVSDHGDTQELLELMLPVLQRNGVDLYINGHDHCLEHISSRDGPIQYLTSGGGSKAWRGVYKPNEDEVKFFYDGQGFMTLEIRDEGNLEFVFYDVRGKPLHKSRLTKDLIRSVVASP